MYILMYDTGTFLDDVLLFLTIFDLPTYFALLYNVPFLGKFWTPLPTLIWDFINERSLLFIASAIQILNVQYLFCKANFSVSNLSS